MKIEALIDLLQDLVDANPGAEVRFMSQPNWPFEYSIRGVTTSSEITDEDDLEGDEEDADGTPPEPPTKQKVIYLVEGTQLGYGSKAAWDVCRSF